MPDDLYQALVEGGEPGPYLLVGHGEGGFVARAFADHYPDEVVGIVLVDPEPDHFLEQAAAILPEEMLRTFAQTLAGGDEFRELRSEVSDRSLGDLPLILIGADVSRRFTPGGELGSAAASQLREAWGSGQEELAALSSNGQLRIAEGSEGFIPWGRPDLVVDAIIELTR
jgi:pimeloyl-ACP methyl ester carboxylesterase